MSLSEQQVRAIAELARLTVPREAQQDLVQELSAILDFVEQMNAVDTEGVVPMAHPLDVPQRLRPDVVTEHVDREKYQALAPAVANGLYLVPKVIE